MTQTTLLSTRIATLEAIAAPLPELLHALDVLNVERDRVLSRITTAQLAASKLELIGLHVDPVLKGTVPIAGGADLAESAQIVPEANTLVNSEFNSEPEAGPAPLPVTEPLEEESSEGAASATPDDSAPAGQQKMAGDNSESNSESGVDFTPDSDRLRAWIGTLDGNEFAAADASEALGIAESSCTTYLRGMRKAGEIDRVPGTGKPGTPSRYVQSGLAAPGADTAVPAPVADSEAEDEQQEASGQPSRGPRTLDEGAVLARMQDGALYSHNHLIHHLQIGRTRVERATNGLCQDGLIGRRGELFVVIPEELADAVAS